MFVLGGQGVASASAASASHPANAGYIATDPFDHDWFHPHHHGYWPYHTMHRHNHGYWPSHTLHHHPHGFWPSHLLGHLGL
ncbi:hypothetical protein SAMN05421869_13450 [Nonomuraea jiangxiensis]|uniref:Uncharacterized protein n=1 Tax=Nonomuraea jiangxiensis TaxID=633440 RepID=A0A1G9PNN9_9ACTN|nr:hypothetical protein SAMN05421869_13450 [Nonomuraea jiangxiensis]